jgi:hypothetical protein
MCYNHLEYLVKWKGYDESHNQWEVHTQSVRGHLSVSLPPLSSPTLPLFICIPPLTSVPSPGTTPTAGNVHTRQSDDFLDVDSPEIDDFYSPPSLRPERHRMSCGRIRTGPHDTTAPSAMTWTPIYGRLGTRRLGTVTLCISFID